MKAESLIQQHSMRQAVRGNSLAGVVARFAELPADADTPNTLDTLQEGSAVSAGAEVLTSYICTKKCLV